MQMKEVIAKVKGVIAKLKRNTIKKNATNGKQKNTPKCCKLVLKDARV